MGLGYRSHPQPGSVLSQSGLSSGDLTSPQTSTFHCQTRRFEPWASGPSQPSLWVLRRPPSQTCLTLSLGEDLMVSLWPLVISGGELATRRGKAILRSASGGARRPSLCGWAGLFQLPPPPLGRGDTWQGCHLYPQGGVGKGCSEACLTLVQPSAVLGPPLDLVSSSTGGRRSSAPPASQGCWEEVI